MSYLALARKWRPRTFSQLVGQEHINKPLINALNQQRLHHAYLFTGTRGVGKTSVARILAKALNCESGISATPCLHCDACLAIEQGRFIDLIEIDGASKTRIEDTRDLLDNVPYAPASGRFKIYLIDEVHMLSQHSFNALLKTLEEPPAHVKFILATTDPQKLPITVLSRCLQFNLRHLPADLINEHLQFILQEEQLSYEQEALSILSYAAQGSMRDALSLLDQAITSCGDRVLANEVKTILGHTQHDYALQLINALAGQDALKLISLSQQITAEGGQFRYVLDELLHYFHQMALYQNLGDKNPLIQPALPVKQLATQFSAEDLQLFYQICLKGCEEIQLAPTLAVGFNMVLLRMLIFRPESKAPIPSLSVQQTPLSPPKEEAVQHLEPIKNATTTPIAPLSTPNASDERTQSTGFYENNKEQQEPPRAPLVGALAAEQRPVEENRSAVTIKELDSLPDDEAKTGSIITSMNWVDVIPQLRLTGLSLNAIENAEFVAKEGKSIILKVVKGHLSLFTPGSLSKIEAALTTYCNETIKITIKSEEQTQASPAQQKEKASQQRQQNATQALHGDVLFQQIQQEFSAELVKNSIVSLKDDL